jgi:hypothetical protein
MMFWELIDLYSENNAKHADTNCGENIYLNKTHHILTRLNVMWKGKSIPVTGRGCP